MLLLDSFRSALQSLVTNKLRSSLTMLGVIIGVSSVIAMVAVGNGGAASQNLTEADMRAVADQLGGSIRAIEAEQGAGRWQVTAAGTNWNTNVEAVTEQCPAGRDWTLQAAEFFPADQLLASQQVAVLGATTAANLFGDSDAVGQTIQLRQAFGGGGGGAASRARILNFKVIGVLSSKGSTFGFSRDDQILVPLTTGKKVLTGRRDQVSAIVVKALDSDTMTATTD